MSKKYYRAKCEEDGTYIDVEDRRQGGDIRGDYLLQNLFDMLTGRRRKFRNGIIDGGRRKIMRRKDDQ